MSEISSAYSSTSRITGIYSELDTDAIVKDLLEIEQTKIDSKEQEKTTEEWYYDALEEVTELVEDFQSTYLSALGSNSMLTSSTYKSFSVSVDDSSAVSVSASSSALTGRYTIDSVTQMAENAGISSTGISADGTSISEYNTTALANLNFANELEFDSNDQISFSINNVEFTFDSDTTLQTMINTVNADEDAGVTMTYSRLTDGFSITADEGGASSSVTIGNITGNAFGEDSAFGIDEGATGDQFAAAITGNQIATSGSGITRYSTLGEIDTAFGGSLFFGQTSPKVLEFTINGVDFSFGEDTSMLDMMYEINSSAAGVTMTFDSNAYTFSLTSDAVGEDAEITITNTTGYAFGDGDGDFGIGVGTVTGSTYGTEGQDAVCSIEGVEVTRDSNEFSIDGITYELTDTTDEAVDFTVSRDFTSTVDAISTFIDAYNELVEKLNDLLGESDYSADYKPLTAAQEDDMTESQIEKWNEKAMSGLLRNNSDLKSFLSNIKNAFFTSLGGTEATMASLGITTASYFSDDAGKILIDEDVLTAALEENPETVISMFTESEDGSEGLIYKISDAVDAYLDNLEDDEDGAADRIDEIEDKIEEMEDDLDNMAERYYDKFAVMEEALAKLNSMSSMLSSLLSG